MRLAGEVVADRLGRVLDLGGAAVVVDRARRARIPRQPLVEEALLDLELLGDFLGEALGFRELALRLRGDRRRVERVGERVLRLLLGETGLDRAGDLDELAAALLHALEVSAREVER